jgi:hypothetical protein
VPRQRPLTLLVVTAAFAALAQAQPAGAAIRSLSPTADAYVNAYRPDANYGGARLLRVGRRPARRAYIRFRVPDTAGSVERATLLLYVRRGSARSLRVGRVGNRWRESSITWRRQPGLTGREAVRGGPVRRGMWISADVTSFVKGAGRYSFRVSTGTGTSVALKSGGGRRPRLEVEITPPVNTAPPQVVGLAEEGGTLKVDPGTWSGSKPMTYANQWQRCADGACADVTGATAASYVLGGADAGSTVRVVVSASNAAGSSSAVSPETVVVVPPSEPPGVTITTSPGASTISTSATFAWTTTGTVPATQCQLDDAPFADCASPSSYSPLSVGSHVFTVRVSNAAGWNSDTASWVVTAGAVVWSADHESGDMSQWPSATLNWDSGECLYHGVSRDFAHSGSYSMKLVIDTSSGKAGCRQARLAEIQTGRTYVYSIWYYLPAPVLTVSNHWNVFQFKSKRGGLPSDPIWTVDFQGNPLRAVLAWKGGNYGLAGPQASDGVIGQRDYRQVLTTVPVGRWTHLEVYLDQSPDFDGRITVWQDGVKIADVANVRTRYPDGDARWAVNNYSNGLTVNPYALYLDDAAISLP